MLGDTLKIQKVKTKQYSIAVILKILISSVYML